MCRVLRAALWLYCSACAAAGTAHCGSDLTAIPRTNFVSPICGEVEGGSERGERRPRRCPSQTPPRPLPRTFFSSSSSSSPPPPGPSPTVPSAATPPRHLPHPTRSVYSVSAPSDREPLLLPARSPAGARGGRCRLSSTRRWPNRTSGVRFFLRPRASRERRMQSICTTKAVTLVSQRERTLW